MSHRRLSRVPAQKTPRTLPRFLELHWECARRRARWDTHAVPRRCERKARRNPSPMKRLGKFLTEPGLPADKTAGRSCPPTGIRRSTAPLIAARQRPSSTIARTRPHGALLPARRRASNGMVEDVPSVWKRPLKLPTVKFLELHGSLNWLWCPTCSRLFASPTRNIGRAERLRAV